MRVLRRKMFGGGYAHRGTGITSGFLPAGMHGGGKVGHIHGTEDYDESTTPYIPKDNALVDTQPPFKISTGDKSMSLANAILDYPIYRELFAATVPEREKLSKAELIMDPAMKFFGKLMSGKSYQEGLGGALEITGKALEETAPSIGESLKIKRQFEEAGRKEDVAISQMALQKAMETTPGATIKDIPANIFNQMSRSEQEKVLGIGPEHKDEQTVKGIPISIFNDLNKTEQSYILGTAKVPEDKLIKGVPIEIYNDLSQNAKNKILGITDDPVIIKGIPENIFNDLSPEDQNRILVPSVKGDTVKGIPMEVWNKLSEDDQKKILVPTTAGEKVKGIPIEIWNKLSEEDQNKILVPTIAGQTVKGIPIDIWNKFSPDQQAIIAGAKSAKEQTVKGIPLSTFEGFSDADKAKIIGIDPQAKNLKVTESGENMVAVWTVGDVPHQKVIGPAPVEGDDKLSREEAAIAEMDGMLGKLKADFPMIGDTYKWMSPEESTVITQEDIDYIQQRMRNSFAIAATTETRELTLAEQEALAFAKMINEKIDVPIMDRINANANMSGERYKTFEPMLIALEGFKPGSLVDIRMALGKLVELIGPENMTEGMRKLMKTLKLGSPASADILSVMSNKNTLAIAAGEALPGNLNMKEFETLEAAGLPLWTTKEGSQILLEIYKREDDINLQAQIMMGELVQARKSNKPLTITYPDDTKQSFEDFTEGLTAIERFVDLESTTLVSGSKKMGTGDLTNRIQGMNYDMESLEVSNEDIVEYKDKKYNAREMLSEGRLVFIGFGEPGSTIVQEKKEYEGSAVYVFDTGDWYTKEIVEQLKKQGKDTSQYLIGDPIFKFWKP